VTVVVGGQWGDEGKGKIIDALAGEADLVVRANGSANAGHTVVTDVGVFKFHLIPSGILHPTCTCVIGAGVALDPDTLLGELEALQGRGVSTSNLKISSRSHLIMPYHPVQDRLEEEARGDDRIGTTQRGNGPCYADKVARRGVRVVDIVDPENLRARLAPIVTEKNALLGSLYDHPPYDLNELAERLAAVGEQLAPYVVDSEALVQDAVANGARVVLEGAQAAMLDIDYGTYPFVTSSSPTAAGICQGAGVAPTQVDRVISVYKAYVSRVGSGPFPTELADETGEYLRERGAEYGTTTGRPRRTGWFDAVQARYSARLNGTTDIALTKFDILDDIDPVRICVGYEIDGRHIDAPPPRIDDYARVRPMYDEMPGWTGPTSEATSLDELPSAAQDYIRRIEETAGTTVRWVGVGPHRDQLLGEPIGRRN
jgi:adenylosuccinate synthase